MLLFVIFYSMFGFADTDLGLKCSLNFLCSTDVCEVPEERSSPIPFTKNKDNKLYAAWDFDSDDAIIKVEATLNENKDSTLDNTSKIRLTAKYGLEEVNFALVDKLEHGNRFFQRFSFPKVHTFENKKFKKVSVSCKVD